MNAHIDKNNNMSRAIIVKITSTGDCAETVFAPVPDDPETPFSASINVSEHVHNPMMYMIYMRNYFLSHSQQEFSVPSWNIAPGTDPRVTEEWLNAKWEASIAFEGGSKEISYDPQGTNNRFRGVTSLQGYNELRDHMGSDPNRRYYLAELEHWLASVDPSTLDSDLRERLAMYCMIDGSMGGRLGPHADRFATPTADKDTAIARMIVGGSASYEGTEPIAVIQEYQRISDKIHRSSE